MNVSNLVKSFMKLFFVFISLLFFNSYTIGQQYFIEFIVDEVDSFEKAKDIKLELDPNTEIQMVRMDHNTGRCFIVLNEGIIPSEEKFVELFSAIGYDISCYYDGIRGKDVFVDIKRGKCN